MTRTKKTIISEMPRHFQFLTLVLVCSISTFLNSTAAGLDEEAEMERAMAIIGPERADNNCSSCHSLEYEAWLKTTHYATFKVRHRTDEAKVILANMGEKSMKRAKSCRQCHYTSVIKKGKLRATWGISCESCHGPAKMWNNVHNKVGGDPSGQTMVWGTGKNESPEQRAARLGPARENGMVNSDMIYDIATNCFGCHTVPNETLVNKGMHNPGSDFDLAAWSQGQIRHNFSSSEGAPDSPSNRPSSAAQKRRLYIVGAMVDLEFSLRNLANAKEQNGRFHVAMADRVTRAQKKIDTILKTVDLPELTTAFALVPSSVDTSTTISEDLAPKLSEAARLFVQNYDGTNLGAVDSLIPTEVKGDVFQK